MAEQIGPKGMLNTFKQELPMWRKNLPKLPRFALDAANNSTMLRIEMDEQKQQLTHMEKQLNKLVASQRRSSSLFLSAAIASASYLFSYVCLEQHRTEPALIVSGLIFFISFGLLSFVIRNK